MERIWTTLRRGSAALALTGTVAVAGGCASAASISAEQEAQLGAQYAAEINRQLPIIQNTAIHYYINQLGNTIARRVNERGLDYTFFVVNSSQVNAFAIPGGYVYINRGLIERADNMSEVAGVLAHEIGHVVERHGLEQMARMQNTELGVNLAYILMGRAPSGLEQVGLQVGAGAFFAQHSREAENEADRVAVEYLARSGINPQGLVTMFQKLLAERQRSPGAVDQWFATHPLEEDRIQNVSRIIQSVGGARGTSDSQAFHDFQQRLRQLPPPPQ